MGLVLLVLAAVIAIAGAARHWFAVQKWLDGAFRTVVTTDHAVTTRGQEIAREVPTGDVLSVTSTDMERIGGVYDVTARFAGALVAYAVVAAMLVRASLETGLVVLIGGPVLMASREHFKVEFLKMDVTPELQRIAAENVANEYLAFR